MFCWIMIIFRGGGAKLWELIHLNLIESSELLYFFLHVQGSQTPLLSMIILLHVKIKL